MTTERWKGWKGDSHLMYICGYVALLEVYVHLWLCCNTGVTDICRCVALFLQEHAADRSSIVITVRLSSRWRFWSNPHVYIYTSPQSSQPHSQSVTVSETLVCVFLVGSFHANDWSLNCGLELPGQLAPEQAAYV